ncbi:MAG: hypothetical protein H7068_11180 [Pedobacter sp.]|nr:hypothetical protein [Chitinophagaceae bacterium]
MFIINRQFFNGEGRTGVLVDKFLGKEKILNLDSANAYNFTDTNVAASYDVNRFLIIFRQAEVLAIRTIDFQAKRITNNEVSLKWKPSEGKRY